MAPRPSKHTCCGFTPREIQKRTIYNRYLFILLHYNIAFCRKGIVKYLFETQTGYVDLHNEAHVLYFLGFSKLCLFLSDILTLQARN